MPTTPSTPRATVLDDIISGVREDLAAREAALSFDALRDLVADAPATRDPMPALRGAGVQVIAEVKRASPSKGDLADIPDPTELAGHYATGGAAAISVLTEQRRFKGSLEDLRAVRAAVDTPVLRKDFLVTSYQLWEARAAGADLVLLIVAGLDPHQLAELHAEAVSLDLTPLVEVHDEAEVDVALAAGASLVGVNNRDLRTLEVDRGQFGRVARLVPEGVVRVAESGIRDATDVADLCAQGADVVLVGEALVRTGDPVSALKDFRAAGADVPPRPAAWPAP